jgi:hypothetical protein
MKVKSFKKQWDFDRVYKKTNYNKSKHNKHRNRNRNRKVLWSTTLDTDTNRVH